MGIFNRTDPAAATRVEESGETKPPEKTVAEIIAESMGAALKPLVDSNAALMTRLQAVEEATKPKPKPAATQEPVEIPSVFDDENGAINYRIAPLFQRQLEMEARMTRDEIRQEYAAKGYAEVWSQFAEKINTTLENSPLVGGDGKAIRGDRGYIRNVVNMIFGEAAMAAGMRFGGKDKGFFLESAGGSNDASHTTAVNDGLTDKQRAAAAKWGIPVADLAKAKGKLEFIN